jgi:hypothetical protein
MINSERIRYLIAFVILLCLLFNTLGKLNTARDLEQYAYNFGWVDGYNNFDPVAGSNNFFNWVKTGQDNASRYYKP